MSCVLIVFCLYPTPKKHQKRGRFLTCLSPHPYQSSAIQSHPDRRDRGCPVKPAVIRPVRRPSIRQQPQHQPALEGSSSSSSSIDDALARAIDACAAASSAAEAAGANAGAGETADDLSARDLRWALPPGWRALLLAKKASNSASSSVAQKCAALLEASEGLKGFLASCQELGVAPKEALATLKEAEDDADDGGDDDDGGEQRPPLSVGAFNPEARRAAKIAAFRAKRELQGKLAKLREKEEARRKKKRTSSPKAASAPAAEAANEEDDDEEESDDEEDEEELREAVLAELALICIAAADEVLAIKEEATMLRHALRREREAEARGSGGSGSGGGARKEEDDDVERKRKEEASAVATALRGAFSALSTTSAAASASSQRPAFAPASVGASSSALGLGGLGLGGLGLGASSSSLLDRGAAAASVFRPSHLLPTMSLEEFADREVADARARSEADRARRAAAAAAARDASSADDGGDDGRTEADGGVTLDRLRALDDWKDDHPYGYGNSKRRPAATGSK